MPRILRILTGSPAPFSAAHPRSQMSNLQKLIVNARAGLALYEKISDADWQAIARQCGAAEVEEIEQRIVSLRVELETVEDWDGDGDGDTLDEIHASKANTQRIGLVSSDRATNLELVAARESDMDMVAVRSDAMT
eukprot:gene1415-1979_t